MTHHFNIHCVARVDHQLGSSSCVVIAPVDRGGVCSEGNNVGVDSCVAAADPRDVLQRPEESAVVIQKRPVKSSSQMEEGVSLLAHGMHANTVINKMLASLSS